MPNITKSAVHAFVRSEYLKKHEPLRNARKEALQSAIESSHLFIDFKNIMASAESVASALEKAGYGSEFRRNLVSCDKALNRTIGNLYTAGLDNLVTRLEHYMLSQSRMMKTLKR